MNKWKLVIWIVAISVIAFAILLIKNGYSEVGVRLSIRLSARIAATLFAFAFIASSLQYFYKRKWTSWMLRNRKYLGISFAIIHLIHLFFLALLQISFHPVFERAATISLVGGGLAYVFVVLMLLTSFEKFSSWLTKKQWILLHTAGGYWIWYIFARSYFKRVNTELEYLPLLLLFGAALIFRLTKIWHKRYASKPTKSH